MVFLDIKGTIYYRQIKYINIKYYYIKERIEDREIKLFYIPISKIIANSLIKSLSTSLFIRNIR